MRQEGCQRGYHWKGKLKTQPLTRAMETWRCRTDMKKMGHDCGTWQWQDYVVLPRIGGRDHQRPDRSKQKQHISTLLPSRPREIKANPGHSVVPAIRPQLMFERERGPANCRETLEVGQLSRRKSSRSSQYPSRKAMLPADSGKHKVARRCTPKQDPTTTSRLSTK